jgi:hypothetical protein
MNNNQLQEAIRVTQELAANKDAWGSAKELAIAHLRELYAIQRVRANMAITPRVTLGDIK